MALCEFRVKDKRFGKKSPGGSERAPKAVRVHLVIHFVRGDK